MRERRVIRLWASVAACGALALPLATAPPASARGIAAPAGAGLRAVQGLPALPAGAVETGRLTAATRVSMRVVLAPRDPVALARFVAAVSSPSSARFRHFLPRGQFAARFGPTPVAIGTVVGLLRHDGLTVTSISPSHLVLAVSGTASSFGTALHAPLVSWRLRTGAVGYRIARAARLPAAVAPLVAGVVGVSSFLRERSFAVRPTRASIGRAIGVRATPTARAGPRTAPSNPPCADLTTQTTPPSNSYAPYQIGQAYGLDTAWSHGFDGTGRTVAVEEFAPYATSDVVTYDTCNGILPLTATSDPKVHNVLVDGGTSPGSAGGSDEPTLDLEELRTLAPGATLDVYLGPNNVTGPIDVLQRIASDDTAQAVSISWGICEAFSEHADETPIFEQLAAQGQAVFAASGDSGSSDCLAQTPPGGSVLAGAAVDDPAAQPLVTGVGGLTVTQVSPPDQAVWNDCVLFREPACLGDATGGGISTVFRRPAWQAAPSVPTGTARGATARLVPDLSVMGDPATGMVIFYDHAYQPIGGTSMGAPLMSALDVVAAQACGAETLGFLNPLLYAMARHGGAFIDVSGGSRTTENNAVADSTLRSREYFAHPGYDMASGLGSPNPATFLQALCDGPATASATPPAPGASSDWVVTFHTGAAAATAGAALTVTAPPGTSLATAAWSVTATSGNVALSGVRYADGPGSATPNVATLTLGGSIPPVDQVKVAATGVTNPHAVGTGTVTVTSSTDGLVASAPLQLTTAAPDPGRTTVVAATPRAALGGPGAEVTVTVRDALGDAVLGARVAVGASGHGHAVLPMTSTSGSGRATFWLRDDRDERTTATVTAAGVAVGTAAVRFVDPWTALRPRVLGVIGRVVGAPAVTTWSTGWVGLVRTVGGTLAALAPRGRALRAVAIAAPRAATTPSMVTARGWVYAAYRTPSGDLVVLRHPGDGPLGSWRAEDLTARGAVPTVTGAPTLALAGAGRAARLSVAVVTTAHLVDAATATLAAPTSFAARSISSAASQPATAIGSVAQVPDGSGIAYVARTMDGRLVILARVGPRWAANDLAQSALFSVDGADAIAGDPTAVPSPLGDAVVAVTRSHRVVEFEGVFENWTAEPITAGVGGVSPPAGHATVPAFAGTPVVRTLRDATSIVVTTTRGRLVELRTPGVADPWAAYDLTLLARLGPGVVAGAAALPGRGPSLLCDDAGRLVEVRAASS